MIRAFFGLIFCPLFGHKRQKCVSLEGEIFIACPRCKAYLATCFWDENAQDWVGE